MAPPRSPWWNGYKDQGGCEKTTLRYVSCDACDREGIKQAARISMAFAPVLMTSKRAIMERHTRDCKNIRAEAADQRVGAEWKRRRDDDASDAEPDPKRAPTNSAVSLLQAVSAESAASASAASASATSATRGVASKLPAVGSMSRFVDRELTQHESEFFIDLCIELVAHNNLAASFFESPSTVTLFTWLRPGCQRFLPSGKVILGPRLEAKATEEVDRAVRGIKDAVREGGALAVKADAWKSVSKEHILGTIASCGGVALPFDKALGDGSGNVQTGFVFHGIAVAKEIEEVLSNVQEACGEPVRAFCSDMAGQNGRAQRILKLRHPQIYFGGCYAHGTNNIFKKVFFTSIMADTTNLACKLVDAFNHSTPWLNRLWEQQIRLYGRKSALIRALKERWSTGQGCFASISRTRGAIEAVVTDHHSDVGAPEVFNVIYTMGTSFWAQMQQVQELARPLLQANLWMQRQDTTLADVFYMYGRTYRSLDAVSSSHGQVVQARWHMEEQPLLLLTAALSPKHVADIRTRLQGSAKMTKSHLSCFAILYYRKFISTDSGGVGEAMRMWLDDGVAEGRLYDGPMVWTAACDSSDAGVRKLAQLYKLVSSFPTHTADCERLFSEFGLVMTKPRNRLHARKLHRLVQVKRVVGRRIMELKLRKERNRKRILDHAELPRRSRGALTPPDHQQETNEGGDDCSMVQPASVQQVPRRSDDEEPDVVEVPPSGDVGDAWAEALEQLEDDEDDDACDEVDELLTTTTLSSQVAAFSYDTGAEHRARYPLPAGDEDVDKFVQEKRPPGPRGWKVPLLDLFPPLVTEQQSAEPDFLPSCLLPSPH
eukprot:GHVU01121859.1.p1 GENE.GHVU01121859.1~~GHVU01121859.1.p1  ORF type:complete len:870 (-),score=97.99 GHVU01121859.1:677-3163(-)